MNRMLRPISAAGLLSVVLFLAGCAVTSPLDRPVSQQLAITGMFAAINAGGPPVTLTANAYVDWALTLANQSCSPGCGTLSAKGATNTAIYTPPATAPVYGTASILLVLPTNDADQFIQSFRIVPQIQVSITSTKFASIIAGSAPVALTANISNDIYNKGLTWTLTAGGANCSPACGTLSVSASPSLTATFTPPATAPTGAMANPTITAASVNGNGLNNVPATDSFSFAISPAIQVTITNKIVSELIGSAPVNLIATIQNDPLNQGLTWSLAAAGVACSPACGTLAPAASPSLSAVYTPPATEPPVAEVSPTITVSSVTNPLATDTDSFSIIGVITVTITSQKFATAYAGAGAVTLAATVSNDATGKGVLWTLTGSDGSPCSPGCGSISQTNVLTPSGTYNAAYTPPQSLPTGAADNPTITVSSVANPAVTDSFSFVIASSNSLFKGSYAFLMRGYNTSGNPIAMAGSFASDGNGHITAGEIDLNADGGYTFTGPLTGTYSAAPSTVTNAVSGNIQTSYTFPSSSANIAFDFTLSADGARGRIIEIDGSGFRESGTLLQQDPAALAAANPSGTYAFGLDADASLGGSTRTVEIGEFTLGATGNITSGLVDLEKAEAVTVTLPKTPLNPTAGTAPDALGRGQLMMSVTPSMSLSPTPPGSICPVAPPLVAPPTCSALYRYYVVNSKQLFLIEADSGWNYATAQAGTARLQQNINAANALSMTSVFQWTGIDVSSGGLPYMEPLNTIGPHVQIGQMIISGVAPAAPPAPAGWLTGTFSVVFDSNDMGAPLVAQHTIPDPNTTGSMAGQVSYDPSTGWGTIQISFGYDQGFVNLATFYLYAPGAGFIIDEDPSPNTAPPALAVTNQGYSGTFVPQVTHPELITFSGNLLVYTGASSTPGFNNPATLGGSPPLNDIPVVEGSVNVDTSHKSSDNGPCGATYTWNANFVVDFSSIDSGNFPNVCVPGGIAGAPADPNPASPDPINNPLYAGHGTEFLPDAFFGQFAGGAGYTLRFVSIYAIGPNQFVAIGRTGAMESPVTTPPPPQLPNLPSGIIFFDPQESESANPAYLPLE